MSHPVALVFLKTFDMSAKLQHEYESQVLICRILLLVKSHFWSTNLDLPQGFSLIKDLKAFKQNIGYRELVEL
jgi:hypothetical protein